MIKLDPSDKTPAIEFNPSTGELSIRGKSFTENAFDFYQPLIDEIIRYKKQPSYQTAVHIQLEYFNTSSSKCLLDILRELEDLKHKSEITVNWYYEKEDDDMLEVGYDYQEIVGLPFKMVEIR